MQRQHPVVAPPGPAETVVILLLVSERDSYFPIRTNPDVHRTPLVKSCGTGRTARGIGPIVAMPHASVTTSHKRVNNAVLVFLSLAFFNPSDAARIRAVFPLFRRLRDSNKPADPSTALAVRHSTNC